MAVKVNNPPSIALTPRKKREAHKFCMLYESPSVARLLIEAGYKRTTNLLGCELVIFGGDAPVHPFLYGEMNILNDETSTKFDIKKDREETRKYKILSPEVAKVGVNRGALLLNILNGGRSYQYVDHHKGPAHSVVCEEGFFDSLPSKKNIYVGSEHTQMMIPGPHAITMMYAKETTERREEKRVDKTQSLQDPEMLWYWTTNTLCVQYDPAVDLPSAQAAFINAIDNQLLNLKI